MGYLVFGDDERMSCVRTYLAAEATAVPVCVFAPNITLDTEEIKKIPWGSTVYTGGVKAEAESAACAKSLTVKRYNDSADFITENAEITAEAVIALVLNKSDTMLKELRILVVGFGKCGRAICRSLFGLAADFTVMTSRPSDTVIYSAAIPYGSDISEYDVIINTAPNVVISETQVDNVKKSALIIDIASKPYGLNHGYAVTIGLDSAVYPALPARYRPRSAAKAMVDYILEEKDE